MKQETEEINDPIKIKEEVDPLSTHDYNESDCMIPDDEKNVLFELVRIKEELDPIAKEDCTQIDEKLLKELKHEDEDKCVIPLLMLPNEKQLQPAEELILPDLLTESPSLQIDSECNVSQDVLNLSSSPKQYDSKWLYSLNREKLYKELIKLGLAPLNRLDKCRTLLRDYLKGSHLNKNDQNIFNSKYLPSANGSAPVSCVDVTKQETLDVELITNLSIYDKINDKDNKQIEIVSKKSRSKSTATKKRMVRSTLYSGTPVNSNPVVSHKVLDSGRKLLNNSSPKIIECVSEDLNMELNKNACSFQSELIHRKTITPNDNVQLLSSSSVASKDMEGLYNSNDSFNDDNGDSVNDKTLECNLINKKTTDSDSFDTHKRKCVKSINKVALKSNRVYLSCKLCNRKFSTKFLFKKHEESKCGSSKLFGCSICGRGFLHKSSLITHMSKDHSCRKAEQFNCDLCNKVYCIKRNLVKHKNIYHFSKMDYGMLPQTCKYCQKRYASLRHLRSHVKRKHLNSRPNRFECAHCSRVFTSRDGIILHMQSKHLPSQPKCNFCNHCFSCEKNLQNHLKSGICNRQQRFICDQCGKILKTKVSLTNHLLTHSDEKPFICQTCGKSFKSESNLSQHSVTHSDKRPFSCDICSKSFRIRNHLRQHMGVHGLVNTVVKHRQKNKNKKEANGKSSTLNKDHK